MEVKRALWDDGKNAGVKAARTKHDLLEKGIVSGTKLDANKGDGRRNERCGPLEGG